MYILLFWENPAKWIGNASLCLSQAWINGESPVITKNYGKVSKDGIGKWEPQANVLLEKTNNRL